MEIKPEIAQKIQEVLNSLAKNSSTQGAAIVKERLGLEIIVQSCNVYPFSHKEIKAQIGTNSSVMTAGVFTPVVGDLPGAGFLMLTKDKATKLILSYIGARADHPIYLPAFTPQLILKILTEALTLSFAKSISKVFQKKPNPLIGAPETFFDTWGNTLDLMFSRLNDVETDIYFIFILGFAFSIDKVAHQGFYFYLINKKTLYEFLFAQSQQLS
ncbi:MAG: hypothetical protein HY819_18235 [Acidobacteria bacterium]|nr:hypothetical protein [Acidobacteriota bacterium]